MQPTAEKHGPIIATYRAPRRKPVEGIGLFLIGVMVIGTPLAAGIDRLLHTYAHYGPAAAERALTWLAIALVAFILWAGIVLDRWITSRRSITVTSDGLLYRGWGWPLRRITNLLFPGFITWEDMDGITVKKEVAPGKDMQPADARWTARVSIRPTGMLKFPRPTLRFSSSHDRSRGVDGAAELITRIKANLYPQRYPRLKQQFDGGERVPFGPVKASRSDLRLKGMVCSWERVKRMTILSGHLVVELENRSRPTGKPSKEIRIPAARIPNIELLLQLVEESGLG